MKVELLVEIVAQMLANKTIEVRFPDVEFDVHELVEMRCYQALKKIKAVIEDDSLEDDGCFMKIEEIVIY